MTILVLYLTGERHCGDVFPTTNFGFDLLISKNSFNPLLSDYQECLLYKKALKLGMKNFNKKYTSLLVIKDSSLLVCSSDTLKERISLLLQRKSDLIFLSRWQDKCDKQKILYSDEIGKIKTTIEPNSTQAILFSKTGLIKVYQQLKLAISHQENVKLNKIINNLISRKIVTAICCDPPLFVYDSDLAAHYNFYSKNSTCLLYDNSTEKEENGILMMFLLITIVLLIITGIILRY